MQLQASLFSVLESQTLDAQADELLPEEELQELLDEAVPLTCGDSVMPYVCDDCESIGGYYAASFREIVCPHCGGAAHPATYGGFVTRKRQRPII